MYHKSVHVCQWDGKKIKKITFEIKDVKKCPVRNVTDGTVILLRTDSQCCETYCMH